mmetsp:Transcript_12743/g.53930  ORF Transcript_12743/g.53930 Transcript_12743/m.53930 type:complete len:92 (-) Transcript_12743:132-407(-)
MLVLWRHCFVLLRPMQSSSSSMGQSQIYTLPFEECSLLMPVGRHNFMCSEEKTLDQILPKQNESTQERNYQVPSCCKERLASKEALAKSSI